ncbi:hypothetical protein ASF70_12700 [Rhizobium sp. Leaf321]|uniref:hypothetical protein n=1 Tax=Rhizobium sp. Leaf321 TaxID=1736335 RepID=UPI00071309D7|nr:hypothetical protein [Rhizobium sp. Leaf321]KQQ72387.1 hypothetical protein ASF70_12700 [Rhizobium sp. Leaf321]
MNPFTWIKFGIVVAVASVIGLGYRHYTSIVDELSEAKVSVVNLTTERDAAIKTANDNVAAVKKADADRLRVTAELETVQDERDAALARDLESVTAILTAPDSDNGTVAPLLEALRGTRFGDRP